MLKIVFSRQDYFQGTDLTENTKKQTPHSFHCGRRLLTSVCRATLMRSEKDWRCLNTSVRQEVNKLMFTSNEVQGFFVETTEKDNNQCSTLLIRPLRQSEQTEVVSVWRTQNSLLIVREKGIQTSVWPWEGKKFKRSSGLLTQQFHTFNLSRTPLRSKIVIAASTCAGGFCESLVFIDYSGSKDGKQQKNMKQHWVKLSEVLKNSARGKGSHLNKPKIHPPKKNPTTLEKKKRSKFGGSVQIPENNWTLMPQSNTIGWREGDASKRKDVPHLYQEDKHLSSNEVCKYLCKLCISVFVFTKG